MPIVGGLTSTKMIRSFEKTHPDNHLSDRATLNGRVPVFAVSASLIEKERQAYIDGGFDGWILKPIDFKRLGVLLSGIVEQDTREACLYKPGNWEKGGWFVQQQPDIFATSTYPSATASVSSTGPLSCPPQPEESSTDRERERLDHLEANVIHSSSKPEEPTQSGRVTESVTEDVARQP